MSGQPIHHQTEVWCFNGRINGEIEKIEMEIQEVKNKTLNAEFIKEGLTFFELAWQIADPKQKKDLLHLYVHRVIWAPDKIKMALFMRPVSELMISSKDVNRNGVGAVDCIDWLPG